MSKSSEPEDISIPPDDWAVMLRQAGAPEPWADPDAAQRFAAGITFRWPEAPKRKRGAFDRARDAIAELHRVLPGIIADYERWLSELDNPPAEFQDRIVVAARTQTERELDDLHRLFVALPELRWKLGKPQTVPWHCDAARLYALYLRDVDPAAGISADGPPVRFVQFALVRMRSRGPTADDDLAHAERETIARALRRMGKRVCSRPDKSGMV